MKINKQNTGFTIIELLVVVGVIGILVTLAVVSYGGFQAKAYDTSVLSDIDTMEALQTSYGLNNHSGGKNYNSTETSYDSDLDFEPSEGNVIVVVTDSVDYCIRGYNPNGTKDSLENAFMRESTEGACGWLLDGDEEPGPWQQISAGIYHACGLADGQAYCWGANWSVQLGNNSTTDSSVPVLVYPIP